MDPTISEMYYLQLPTGGPTQADVWTNLPSGATSETCTGVIITPRCDFAHEKSPVINYLPIVAFEHYLLSAACFGLLETQINDLRTALAGKAEAAGLGGLAELGVPFNEIEKCLELARATPEQTISKQKSKAAEEFIAGLRRLTALELLTSTDRLTLEEVKRELGKKQFSKLQRDIIRNNTTDTYFLPPCETLLPQPCVVLLRQIYTCPITVVGGTHERVRPNDAPVDVVGKPERLLRIKSPFVESLMAKFSALFMRVGTRDLPEQSVPTYMIMEREMTK